MSRDVPISTIPTGGPDLDHSALELAHSDDEKDIVMDVDGSSPSARWACFISRHGGPKSCLSPSVDWL